MSIKTKQVLMSHISGMSEYSEGSQIKVFVSGDKVLFNNKQIIPFSRIKGSELGMDTLTVEGRPIQKAFAVGLISAVVGANTLGYVTGDGETMFIVCGIVGAIIGAISGARPKKKTVTTLSIFFQSIEGNDFVIRLAENTKASRKSIIDISELINKAVGFKPVRGAEQFTAKSYEI